MKHALFSNYKANKFFRMTKTHFGFDMVAASTANIQRERKFILDSESVINSRTVKDSGAPWTEFPTHMTDAEQIIFDRIIQNITLKHATSAGKEIEQAGRMASLRSRERQGQSAANRHTTSAQGQDESIYYVTGLGKHNPPGFVENSSHLVTIQLAALMKEDPAVTSRLWLSNHWTEYQQETPLKLVVGNARLNIQYAKKDQKHYLITYEDGSELKWSTSYQEELFIQKDVLPGIAFSFISLLRLLNAKPNPLIQNLYELAKNQDPGFNTVLEELFNTLIPGNQRLEAKIIDHLDMNSPFVSLERQTGKPDVFHGYEKALQQAIKLNDFELFSGLFEQIKDSSSLNLYSLAESILSEVPPSEQKRYFTLLIEAGFAADNASQSNRFLEQVIEKDDPDLLDFFLGYPVPNPAVTGLKRILHSNPYGRPFGMSFNLVERACHHCRDVRIFEVLAKYGVDFQKHLPVYLESAFVKYSSEGINYTAIKYLGNKGDLTLRGTECKNLTPLMYAINSKNLPLARFFIEKLHADVNEPYKMYRTSYLAGRSFSESPENGQTALHLAAKAGNEEIVNYLLSQGANPWLSTVNGERPIDWTENTQIKDLLKKHMEQFPQGQEDTSSSNHKKQIESHLSHHTKVVVMLTGVNPYGLPYVVLGKRRPGKYDDEESNNYLCFPGGNVDGRDESYEMAALRELKEETSVDVSAIAASGSPVSIKEIGHFDVNVSNEHKTTKFFVVDVGNYPINIHPSDDLITAQKVTLNSIQRDDSKPLASYLSSDGVKILGSNALFLDDLLMQKSETLSSEQRETVSYQLKIEYQGAQLLSELLNESDSMIPNTPRWEKLVHLLKNNAHLMGGLWRLRSTLALQMTALNSKEGLTLLHEYGVECEYPGELKGHYDTPLAHCARTNNVDLAKHLISLGANPFYHHNKKFLLRAALESESMDMYHYLLEIGVTPNQYEPESRVGDLIIPPIFCDLVKKDKLGLLQQLLSEKTVLLSMDLTPDGKRNSLITAIQRGNKNAAKLLLATMRCPILQKEERESYREEPKNALDYLNTKPEWSDIQDISKFLLEYADMNDFLGQAIAPDCIMDEFVPTLNEKGEQTIHFIGSRQHLLLIVNKLKPFGSTIREDRNGRCYIPMGLKRLGALLNNEKISEFLLNEAKNSMFWQGHADQIANQLYKPALHGNLTSLSNENLESWGLFVSPEKLNFYKVFIQECLNLSEANISFTEKNSASALFLIEAIKNHPCITRLNLSLEKVTNENLDQLIKLLAKLPALEEVHLSIVGLEPADCVRIMEAIAQTKDRSLNISLDGSNSNIIAIAEALKSAKFHHYISLTEASYPCNAALAEANFSAQELFFSTQPSRAGESNNYVIKNIQENKYFRLQKYSPTSLNNMLIQASQRLNPTQINISIDKKYLKKLDQRALKGLFENLAIEAITLSSNTHMLPLLMNSSCLTTLKKFKLEFLKIKTANDLSQLTQLLNQTRHLQSLSLSYVTIKTDSPREFEEFCNAISNHPSLETISVNITFASPAQEQQFWTSLAKSGSLLGFSNSSYKTSSYEIELANTCKENIKRRRDWAQDIEGSSQLSIFSSRSPKQRRIISDIEAEADPDPDPTAPVVWV